LRIFWTKYSDMRRTNLFLFCLLSFYFILSATPDSRKQDGQYKIPQRCPLNPELQNPPSNAHGLIPHTMDLSHLDEQPIVTIQETLPTSWDWRANDGVTPAKNQSHCNVCWAFASTGVLEAKVLIESGQGYDLSEQNVKECNDWLRGCSGGTAFTAASYFTRRGAVHEACDPYVPDITGVCTTTCPRVVQVTGWKLVGSSTAAIKNAVFASGPVYTTMYASFPEFINYDGSYVLYYSGSESSDHAVMIVGWDDHMTHAGGTGAWICKNSWGTAWGDNGFFYIAYGSAKIGGLTNYYDRYQVCDDSETVYHYDEGGWTDSFGFPPSTSAWGLVKFTADRDESIHAVDLWVVTYSLNYTIYIYDDFNGNNVSNLLYSQTGSLTEGAGYYSIPLASPVEIKKNNDFVVVVKYNSSYTYPVTTDYMDTYHPIENGKCYISPDGSSGSWIDMGTVHNRDICIRARAKPAGSDPDFNGDGNADILWRYYGSGGFNAVWLRGTVNNSSAMIFPLKEGAPQEPFQMDFSNDAMSGSKNDAELEKMNISLAELRSQGIGDGFAPDEIQKEDQSDFLSDPFNQDDNRKSRKFNHIVISAITDPRNDPESVDLPAALDTDWTLCGTGDFNRDGDVDLVWRHVGDGRNTVWLMDGVELKSGNFLPPAVNLNWTLCGTGDFNRDSKIDLVWRHVGDGRNAVWLMDGLELSAVMFLPSAVNLEWTLCGTGDFNRDGDVDLVWRHVGDGRNAVWLMDGLELSAVVFIPSAVNLNWSLSGAADFNNDLNVDLLWRNISDGKNAIWLMNGIDLLSVEFLTTVTNLLWKIEN